MKTTDTYNLMEAIRKLAICELKHAIEAHGGSYEWSPATIRPFVMANVKYLGPVDLEIEKIELQDGHLIMTARSDGWPIDAHIGEIAANHIEYITSNIPETHGISDVSMDVKDAIDKFISEIETKINRHG